MLGFIANYEGGEACVCEIASIFNLTQPTISHHLKVLRDAGLVDCERRGTWVHYQIVPSALDRVTRFIDDSAYPRLPLRAS